jgi:hypothetical protein
VRLRFLRDGRVKLFSSADLLLVPVEGVRAIGSSGVHARVRERRRRIAVPIVERRWRVVHPIVPLVATFTPQLPRRNAVASGPWVMFAAQSYCWEHVLKFPEF